MDRQDWFQEREPHIGSVVSEKLLFCALGVVQRSIRAHGFSFDRSILAEFPGRDSLAPVEGAMIFPLFERVGAF